MEKTILNVEGMSCFHCENAITKAVGGLNGVDTVAVDLKGNTVTVEFDAAQISIDRIKEEIDDQGYDVIS